MLAGHRIIFRIVCLIRVFTVEGLYIQSLDVRGITEYSSGRGSIGRRISGEFLANSLLFVNKVERANCGSYTCRLQCKIEIPLSS